jgi:hypothetical protein
MANDCSFDMKVVAKDKETIDRLLSIMKYEDKEFYIYRVRDVDVLYPTEKEGDNYSAVFQGDVAWSASAWVRGIPDPNSKSETGAGYTNLVELCKTLDIGVEIWTSEPGMCFQEHILINNRGLSSYDTTDWTVEYDEETDEPIEDGGFDNYGSWVDPNEIYEEK